MENQFPVSFDNEKCFVTLSRIDGNEKTFKPEFGEFKFLVDDFGKEFKIESDVLFFADVLSNKVSLDEKYLNLVVDSFISDNWIILYEDDGTFSVYNPVNELVLSNASEKEQLQFMASIKDGYMKDRFSFFSLLSRLQLQTILSSIDTVFMMSIFGNYQNGILLEISESPNNEHQKEIGFFYCVFDKHSCASNLDYIEQNIHNIFNEIQRLKSFYFEKPFSLVVERSVDKKEILNLPFDSYSQAIDFLLTNR